METRWPAYFAPFTPSSTCGFLGFNKLEKVAHVGENLLTRLRDRQLTLNPEITTALLGMVDAVRQMLKEIDSTGKDGEIDYPELRATLTRLLSPDVTASSTAADKLESALQAAAPPLSLGAILMQQAGVTPEEILLAVKKQKEGDPRLMGEILVEQHAVRPADVADALQIQRTSRGQAAASD